MNLFKKLKSLLLFAFLFQCLSCGKEVLEIDTKNTNLSDYIKPISTNLQVNTFDTLVVTQTDTSELKYINNEYYYPVVKTYSRKACDIYKEFIDIKGQDAIWPGCIVQSKSVYEGALNPIPLSEWRNGSNIYLNIVSGQKEISEKVDSLTGSNVTQAMNNILAKYKGSMPANIVASVKEVHSLEEMAYHSNMSVEEFEEKIGKTFSSLQWDKEGRSFVLVNLRQIYFTMVYDTPDFKNLFKENFNYSILDKYCSNDNPPCYVSTVSYGRILYLLYEVNTMLPGDNMSNETILKKLFNNEEISGKEKAQYNNSYPNIYLSQIGGNAQEGLKLLTPSLNNIKRFLEEGAVFDPNNVGAPIAYEVRDFYGNYLAKVKDINFVYKGIEYEPIKKENDVIISFKDIKTEPAIKISKDKHPNTSDKSWFKINNIKVIVADPYTRDSIKHNIKFNYTGKLRDGDYKQIGAKCELGKLGENTEKEIIISYNVEYFVKRYSNGVLKWKEPETYQSFEVVNKYIYDSKIGWKLKVTNQEKNMNSLSSLGVYKNVGNRRIEQKINIEIRADRKIQK